jgi:hypothetical protein
MLRIEQLRRASDLLLRSASERFGVEIDLEFLSPAVGKLLVAG